MKWLLPIYKISSWRLLPTIEYHLLSLTLCGLACLVEPDILVLIEVWWRWWKSEWSNYRNVEQRQKRSKVARHTTMYRWVMWRQSVLTLGYWTATYQGSAIIIVRHVRLNTSILYYVCLCLNINVVIKIKTVISKSSFIARNLYISFATLFLKTPRNVVLLWCCSVLYWHEVILWLPTLNIIRLVKQHYDDWCLSNMFFWGI